MVCPLTDSTPRTERKIGSARVTANTCLINSSFSSLCSPETIRSLSGTNHFQWCWTGFLSASCTNQCKDNELQCVQGGPRTVLTYHQSSGSFSWSPPSVFTEHSLVVWGQRHQSVSCMCVSYWGYCSYCEIQSRHLLPSYVTLLSLFSFWAFDYWAEELRTEGVSFQFSSSSSSMRNQCQSVVLCGKRKKLLECLVYW